MRHVVFFFSSRRRHTRFDCDWSSDVCSSDLNRCSLQSAELMSYPPAQRLQGSCCTAMDPARYRDQVADRKSTRLNSSHSQISYAVFCLKKKDAASRAPTAGATRLPHDGAATN